MQWTLARVGMWTGLAMLLLASTARSADLPDGVDPELVLEQFDVASDGDALMLPVELQGKKYLFMLDTGATWSIYDTSLRHLLGQAKGTIQGLAARQLITLEQFASPSSRVGKLEIKADGPVVVMDLRQPQEVLGQPLSGFLGMDFLSKHVVCLDFDHGKVLFLRSPGKDPGISQAITVSQTHLPQVEGYLCDSERPELFLVDTGHGGNICGTLHRDVSAAMLRYGKCQKIKEGRCCDLSGDHVDDHLWIPSLSVGPFVQCGLILSSPRPQSSLGLSYWSRYIVTFDFPHRKLYLKKSHLFNLPQQMDASGLHILRRNGKTIAEIVDRGSPAERSGIRAGDELLVLDGISTATTRMFTLRKLLCSTGKKVPAVLQRGNQRLEVSLCLEGPRLATSDAGGASR